MKRFIITLIALVCLTSLIFAQSDIISPETYASYYGEAFNGRPTASGEIFDMNAYTAAHRTLPFGTMVEVTNLENGKKVIVRINDRGPFVGNREIDISKAAAASLDMLSRGVTRVSLRRIDLNDKNAFGIQNQNTYQGQGEPQASTQYTATTAPQANDQYTAPSATQTSTQYTPQSAQETAPAVNSSQNTDYSQRAPQPQNYPAPAASYTGQSAGMSAQTDTYTYEQKKEPIYIPVIASETAGELWRIQLGSFTREENAMRLVIQLRKIGFDPAYEKHDKHLRVVLYGISPYDLDKVKTVLKENGFNDYVLRQENW